MRLNRIIIIGNCGSGKTYLAGALASSFDIPVINLDNIYFISGTVFQKRSANEIGVAIRKIQHNKKWVVEGVYGDLALGLLKNCELLIWLDIDWPTCRSSIQARGPEAIGIRDLDEAQRWFNWLLNFAENYWDVGDENSFRAHKKIFDLFTGEKKRLCSRRKINEFIACSAPIQSGFQEHMLSIDPTDPAFIANPHPHFRAMREINPVYYHEPSNSCIITGYEVAKQILTNQDFVISFGDFSGHEGLTGSAPEIHRVWRIFQGTMLFENSPDHMRLRRVVQRSFSAKAIADREPRVRAIIHTLLDRPSERSEFDIVRDFGMPLSMLVIMDILGFPSSDFSRIQGWVDKLAWMMDGNLRFLDMEGVISALDDITDYIDTQIEMRKGNPGDDLLSLLIPARDEEQSLSSDELLGMVILLLITGSETTSNVIGTGMKTLLERPDEFSRLKETPGRIPAAIEEMFRFEAPVLSTSRFARVDTEFGGVRIHRGQEVQVIFVAINRDPAKFHDPDRFDPERTDNRHLAFGVGVHHCLGAPLARLEARCAFESLLAGYPDMRIAGEPCWKKGPIFRGLSSLPVCS